MEACAKTTLFLLTVLLGCCQGNNDFVLLDFQGENVAGATQHFRSNATGGKTAWLSEGGCLRFPVCMPEGQEVSVEEVRFSSDGWKKVVAIRIDGQEVCMNYYLQFYHCVW